jgi:hypothetical protein
VATVPQDAQSINFFGGSNPIRGMFSAPRRELLEPGQFHQLKDVRCDTGIPKWRKKESAVLVKPSWATSDYPMGAKPIDLNGERYIAAAWKDGTKTRIALAPSSLSRWVDLTGGGTNQFSGIELNGADPRMTSLTARVVFETIKTPRYLRSSTVTASRDVLLAGNGEDFVRYFDRKQNFHQLDINAATNATPIQITTTTNHQLATGDAVWIEGVEGNLAANGLWNITRINATQFTLDGSIGSGAYTAGGTMSLPWFGVHRQPAVPGGGGSPRSYAFFSQYFGVADHSGIVRTYAAAGVVNQARFNFADSTTAPYTANNQTLVLNVQPTVAANDIATVQFDTSMQLSGKHLYMICEGAYLENVLANIQLEIDQENVAYAAIVEPWVEIYNPNSTDPLRKTYEIETVDSTNARVMVAIPLGNVGNGSGERTAFHLRATWLANSAAPGSNQVVTFLMIATASDGVGGIDCGFQGTTEWEVSYEQRFNLAESPVYPCEADALDIAQCGGPLVVVDGAATASAPKIPILDTWYYDFRIVCAHVALTNTVENNGLGQYPDTVNVYMRIPGKEKAYFAWERNLYAPVFSGGVPTKAWAKQTGVLALTDPMLYMDSSDSGFGFRREYANSNREAPSEHQMCIPKSAAMVYANGRLIVGNVSEEDSGEYGYGDVYGSWDRYPTRFTQAQEEERRGFYFHLPQEKVQTFLASGSAAMGAGRTFIWTDKQLYTIGDPSPFAAQSQNASDLSRAVKMGPHGTLSPMSVSAGYTSIQWLDQNLQLMELTPQGIRNRGKFTIHDRLETSSLASRAAKVCAVFWKDRHYLGVTPSGASSNDRVLVWNERMGAVESEDVPDTKFEHAFLFEPTGGGESRLFYFHSNGTLYAYEELTTGTVAGKVSGPLMVQPEGFDMWFVDEIQAVVTQAASGSLNADRVSRKWGASEQWRSTISVTETGAQYATFRDSDAITKQGADRGDMEDEAWALEMGGDLAPGTELVEVDMTARPAGTSGGKR